ncbi:MAG TPA: histidine kinase [Solirubrobacteraceae bacterium]|nr:histidine kinase [Solirubrobacteraceae bacterium]
MHRGHIALVDAAVPGLVGAAIVAGELLHGHSSSRALPILVAVAAAATLFGRRRAPGLTLAITGLLVALLLHIDPSAGVVAVLAPAVALYSLALGRGRRAQLLGAGVAVAAVIGADLLHSGRPSVLQTLGHAMLVAIPLLAAEAIRAHRSNLSLLRERLDLAERTREQDAERRADQERMRIARELHDVVAHTLTEINVQAAAAAERLDPGNARIALERIEDASHSAIGELRAILGVLRDPERDEAPRSPTPGVTDVEDLVARARDVGSDVRLAVQGQPPEQLSDAVSLAAYRIVQESLTNARRHAPKSPVDINLTFEGRRISISVENEAARPDHNGRNGHVAGVGIKGMTERATAIGGTVDASASGDRFAVRAELPYVPRR